MASIREIRDSYAMTDAQKAASALSLPPYASADEHMAAARTLFRLGAGGLDPDEYLSKNPMDGHRFFTVMRDAVKNGMQTLESAESREWNSLPPDEAARDLYVSEKTGWFEKNVAARAGQAAAAFSAIAETELPDDVAPEDRDLVKRHKATQDYFKAQNASNLAPAALPVPVPGATLTPPDPFSDTERGRLDALRGRIATRRRIAAYDAKMRAQNVSLQYMAVKDSLSEPAREIFKSAIRGPLPARVFGKTGEGTTGEILAPLAIAPWNAKSYVMSAGFPTRLFDQFKALPPNEKQIVASLVYDARHTSQDGWLKTAGTRFLDMAVRVPVEAREEYITDAFRRAIMTDEEWNTFNQTRALLTQATDYKPQDFGYFGNSVIGAVATLPYMGYAMIPYAGTALIAGQTAYEFEQRVAAEGGDTSSLDFRLMNFAGALASAAVEKVQAERILKVPSAMQKRALLLGTWRSAAKAVKLAKVTLTDAGIETAQEALQKGIEDGFVAYGLERNVAQAAASGAAQELKDSGLTMLLVSGTGMGYKGAQLNFSKKYDIPEVISAEMHKAKIKAGLMNIAKADQLRDDVDALAELRDIWNRAGDRAEAVRRFQDLGFNSDQASQYAAHFQEERRVIMGSDALAPDQKRGLLGQESDPRYWLLRAFPDAEVTEDQDGGFSFTRETQGERRTVKVRYHAGAAWDMTSPEGAASAVGALRDATRGLAPDKQVNLTAEEWLALPQQDKDDLIKEHGLVANGWFEPVDRKNGVSQGSLGVLAGTIHLDQAAHPAVLFHEYFHGFTRMLRDAGVMTEADIAKAREEFGAPAIAGEDFNEETASTAFQGFVAGTIHPPDTSILRHLWDALATILNAVRRSKARTTAAATIRESMFEQALAGNFTGIPVSTVASTEAARSAQAKPGPAAEPAGAEVKAESTPVPPVALYKPGDAVFGTTTDPNGTRRKGSVGTIDDVIQTSDGSFSYKVRWESGKISEKPESFFYVEPAAPAAPLRLPEQPVQALTTRTTGKRLKAATRLEMIEAARPMMRRMGYSDAEIDAMDPMKAYPVKEGSPEALKKRKAAGGVSLDALRASDARAEAEKVAAIRGKKGRWESTTPDGSIKVSGSYAVMPLEGPITSDMPGYDSRLQGRSRENVSSRIQINKIARNPQPARLFESPETDGGAPILTRSLNVLSGNGRLLGLRLAAKLGNMAEYDLWVREKADELGIEIPAGIEHPVLVRIIDSTEDQAQLARISELSNRSRVLARGQAEIAEADAKTILDGDLLKLYAPDAAGNVFAASNRDFMSAFVRAVNDDSLIDSDGKPTDAAGDRVRRAMLAIIAGRGPDARTVIRALVEESRAAGMGRVVDGAAKAAGDLVALADLKPQFSLLDELATALREFMQFKLDGSPSVREWVGQQGLFGPARPSIIDKLVIAMADRGNIYSLLQAYIEKARKIDTSTGDMFGAAPTSKEDVLDLAIADTAAEAAVRYNVESRVDRRGIAFADNALAPIPSEVIEREYEAREKRARERFEEAGSDEPATYAGEVTQPAPDNPGYRAFTRRHLDLTRRRTRGEAALQAQADRLKSDPLADPYVRSAWERVQYSYSLAESDDFEDLIGEAETFDIEVVPIHSPDFHAYQDGDTLFVSHADAGQIELRKIVFRKALNGGSPNARKLVDQVNTSSPEFKQFHETYAAIRRELGSPNTRVSDTAREIEAEFFAVDADSSALLLQVDGQDTQIGSVFKDPDIAENTVNYIYDDMSAGDVSVQQAFRFSVSANLHLEKPVSDRMPESTISHTAVYALRSHPDFERAKYHQDWPAAARIVRAFVKPAGIEALRKSLTPGRQLFVVPIIASENHPSLNAIPVAFARDIARRLGGEVWVRLVKASGTPNTDASAVDRFANEQTFQGDAPPADSDVILVDDTFTTGKTLMDLQYAIGRKPNAVTTLSSGRYGNGLIPSAETVRLMLEKGRVSHAEFVQLLGFQPEALTDAQVRQYLFNGASGTAGLVSRFNPQAGGARAQRDRRGIRSPGQAEFDFQGGASQGLSESARYSVNAHDQIAQAFDDWTSKRAYIDNAGNYRVRDLVEVAGQMVPDRGKGNVAPWNKLIKATFPDSAAFHMAAAKAEALSRVRRNAIEGGLLDTEKRSNEPPRLGIPEQQTFRYSVSAGEARNWNTALRLYEQGMLDTSKPVTVLDGTPRILQECGADNLPFVINKGVLDKVTKGKHGIPVHDLRNLQNVIDDPIAVFRSAGEHESIVVLTEIKEGGNNAVVAIHLNAKRGWSEINDIASIHGRDTFNIQTWMKERRTLYYNTKKTLALFRSSGLVVPVEVTARGSTDHAGLQSRGVQFPKEGARRGKQVLTEQDFTLPPPAGPVNPPPPPARYAMEATRGFYSNDSKLVASAASRILDGRDVKPEDYDRLAKLLDVPLTGAEIIDRAKTYTTGAVADEVKAILKSDDPTAAITRLAKQVELDTLSAAVRRGARFRGRIGAIGQKAEESAMKAALQAVRGEDLQAFTVDTSIDITATLMQNPPETFNDKPAGGSGSDAQSDANAAMAAVEQVEREVTPEELAARTARGSNLVDLAKAWWEQERARREARAASRAAKLAAGGTLTDQEAEKEQEDASPIAAIPKELLEAAKVNLGSAQEVAHLFRLWVGQWMIEHSAGRITPKNVWTDPESVEKYRRTVIQQLHDMADRLVDPTDRALPNIKEMIGNIAPSMTVNQIERMSAAVIASIHRNAIRQTQQKATDDLAAIIRKKAVDGPEFEPMQPDVKRKVTAEIERVARMLAKIVYYTDRKAAQEIDNINALLKEREQAIDASHNPAADKSADIQWYTLHLELQLIDRYGGLRYRMPAEIAAAAQEIEKWLDNERAKLADRIANAVEFDQAIEKALAAGVARDPSQHGRPEKEGVIAAFADSQIATVHARLLDLVKHSKGDQRAQALAAVDRVLLLMGEASETYQVTLNRYRKELDQIVTAASGGKPADFLRHLEDAIPDDVARRISLQGWTRMTYGQAVQLYASITQASYAPNVRLHNRQEHARILEGILTAADLRFVDQLRRFYAARRPELSEVLQEVTGIPVWSPDPNYMPVAIHRDPRGGFGTEARVWKALADQLTPRRRHTLDFDESADVLTMLKRANEVAARAIGFGVRGMHIRNILASNGFKQTVLRFHGQEKLARLMEHLKDHLMGVDEKAGFGDGWLVRAAARVTSYTALSWNMLSTAKQLASIPSWVNVLDGGFGEFARAFTSFDRDAMRELVDSDGFRARYGGGMVTEMQEILSDPSTGRLGFVKRLYQLGMQPLQAADMVAALAIGTGVYKAKRNALLDQGVDPVTAMRNAKTLTFNLIEESQQSARPENLPSALRKGGAFARMFFQFASAPLLQWSHEVQAAREAAAGVEGSKQKLARILVINHIVIPLLMQTLTAAWRRILGDDEDEDFWGELSVQMAIGPASRILFLGSATESALRMMLTGHRQGWSTRIVPAESALRLVDQGVVTVYDMITLDWEKAQEDLVKMIESTGAPQRNIIKAMHNYSE